MNTEKKQRKIKPFKGVILSDAEIDHETQILGAKLKEKRESLNLSMDKVCEDLKIGKPQLSKDENGQNNIVYSRLAKYIAYYGIKIKY